MQRSNADGRRSRGKTALIRTALALLPLAAGCAALTVGRYGLSLRELLETLYGALRAVLAGGEPTGRNFAVVFLIRLPRVVLALLAGAGLSVAGTAFQSLFSNPMATPDTLGAASGAGFGAVLALLMGCGLIAVQLAALAGGLLAVGLTWLVSGSRGGRSVVGLVLAGLIMGSLLSALISLVKYVADPESQLPAITYWLMGSLSSANWKSIALGTPFILAGTAALLLLRWRLNILSLPDDDARAVGTNLALLRGIVILSAAMITASCVSMCGQVGWVGLLIPHICRLLFGSDNRRLAPAAAALGAAFLVAVDTLARTLTAAELPISILTAVLGAPVFILLLRRSGGWLRG